ncbi:MAG TPA: [FeFe] hydrogenase H-cluster radical SAM maturase HydG [Bacteroidales bacterium]|nr:[FeFe] hydrogenase H-cluster radical SAM maturase HydG [Bacteroidales bacterium]
MKFNPQQYRIPDEPMKPFIDAAEIEMLLENAKPDKVIVRDIIAKSLDKHRLSLAETAMLINARDEELVEEIRDGAHRLKKAVYGNRIVLFAPLYIGNKCTNNCQYCGFRVSNKDQVRTTLNTHQIIGEVMALEDQGQKRLILVFGEHPDYGPQFIADAARTVYSVKKGNGEIRRVNINAAPLDIEGFRIVKEAGIGTYQIFQETYHPEAYKIYHPSGRKRDYEYRLTALDRAQEAGLDDVGIGALFGLYDWRFEVMGLLRHTNHLEACYNIGPHTISFPRIKDASSVGEVKYAVSDSDFARMVAILRLAVPYTGMILTAREPAHIRTELMKYGISQIDGGTKIELGAYSDVENESQDLNREQFKINDDRSLAEVIDELIETGHIPSFCTACYRLGRTGEHFMEFSVPGFIKNFCSPNAMLTLAEYIEDYASPEVAQKGYAIIEENINQLNGNVRIDELRNRLERIKAGERDLYF